MKRVTVEAEFVNLTPAHKRYIIKDGEGTSAAVAIRRAIDNIFADARLKGKRIVYPIKMRIEDANQIDKNAGLG